MFQQIPYIFETQCNITKIFQSMNSVGLKEPNFDIFQVTKIEGLANLILHGKDSIHVLCLKCATFRKMFRIIHHSFIKHFYLLDFQVSGRLDFLWIKKKF